MTKINENHEHTLVHLIQTNDWLLEILRAVRACHLPDWLVGAGLIRNLVWDHLHQYPEPTPVPDVDVVFFDPHDLTPERDELVTQQLVQRLPHINWEATNQAAVHTWYEATFGLAVPPLMSTADGLSTWPETATCVGVRLLEDDQIEIVAPFGLDDLFQMKVRRNPARVTVEQFYERIQKKKLLEKWPQITIISEQE